MSWLTDLVTGKDPQLPSQGLPQGYISQAPFFNESPKMSPEQQPAHENIMEGLGRTFGSGSSLGDRIFGGPLQTLGGVFGLPQEAASLALSGGHYTLPSQFPQIKSVVGDSSLGQFAANATLDPLNLLAIPAAAEAFKGAVLGKTLASRAAEGLNAIRTNAVYEFPKVADMDKVEKEINMTAGVRQNPDTGYWTWRFDDLEPDVATEMKKRIVDTLQGRVDDTWTQGPPTWKPDNPQAQVAIDQPAMHPVEAAAKKAAGLEMIQTPRNYSEASGLASNIMDDAGKAKESLQQAIRGGLVGDDGTVNKPGFSQILGEDIDNKPLMRALTHQLMDDVFKKSDSYFLTDKAAQEAKDTHDDFDGLYGAFSSFMSDTIKGKLAHIKAFTGGSKETIGDFMKSMMLTDPTSVNIPPDFLRKVVGVARDAQGLKTDNILYDPNNANIYDFINSFANTVSKKAYMEPVQQTIETALSKNGQWENITDTEKELIRNMMEGWMGAPTKIDNQLNRNIVANKDSIRQWALGNQLAESVMAGDVNVQDLTGLRGILGRKAEDLIYGAEKGQPLATQASGAIRHTIHNAMLGGAIDTAVKVLTHTMNTVTEYGIGATLKVMGAYLTNPEFSDMLKGENIINNSNQLFSDTLDAVGSIAPRRTLKDYVMMPFNAAENFTRGINWTTAFNEYSQKMSVGEAAQAATAATRDLMKAYGSADISPYWRNPITRPFWQFQSFPIKQIEKLVGWAGQGHFDEATNQFIPAGINIQNKAIQYMMLLGGVMGYSSKIGLDGSQVFLHGLFPGNIFSGSLADSPTGQLIGGLKNLGSGVVNTLAGGPADSSMQQPSLFWRGIGQLLSLTVPGGRYAQKVAKNAFEAEDFWAPLLSKDWNVRQSIVDHPYFASMLRVNPDPGINGVDRLAALIGFKSIHDVNRQELMDMFVGYSNTYRDAKHALNEAALAGGDVDEVRQRYYNNLMHTYGGVFQRYGVPTHAILSSLEPARESYLQKYDVRMGEPVEQRKMLRLPTDVRKNWSW